eukprot:5842921-Prymnesium_polylepis.2
MSGGCRCRSLRQVLGVNYVVPNSRWSVRAVLRNGGQPESLGKLSHRKPVGGVGAAVVCVPVAHEFDVQK